MALGADGIFAQYRLFIYAPYLKRPFWPLRRKRSCFAMFISLSVPDALFYDDILHVVDLYWCPVTTLLTITFVLDGHVNLLTSSPDRPRSPATWGFLCEQNNTAFGRLFSFTILMI